MRVRIQLIRDNGSLVLDVQGDATRTLSWTLPAPLGHLVIEDGSTMFGFTYRPSELHDEPEQEP